MVTIKKSERKIKETILFTTATKKNKERKFKRKFT